MSDLKQKLNDRMDKLQSLMESNYHLQNPKEVVELIDKVSFAWSVLSEEDRESTFSVANMQSRSKWNGIFSFANYTFYLVMFAKRRLE